MIVDEKYEVVKDGAWWVLRHLGSTVVLFKSLTRANTLDHYKYTYKIEEEE